MELTGRKLEEVLNTELVGKDVGYSHCKFTSALLGVIRIFAKKAGLDESAFSCKEQGQSSAYLTYSIAKKSRFIKRKNELGWHRGLFTPCIPFSIFRKENSWKTKRKPF